MDASPAPTTTIARSAENQSLVDSIEKELKAMVSVGLLSSYQPPFEMVRMPPQGDLQYVLSYTIKARSSGVDQETLYELHAPAKPGDEEVNLDRSLWNWGTGFVSECLEEDEKYQDVDVLTIEGNNWDVDGWTQGQDLPDNLSVGRGTRIRFMYRDGEFEGTLKVSRNISVDEWVSPFERNEQEGEQNDTALLVKPRRSSTTVLEPSQLKNISEFAEGTPSLDRASTTRF